MLRPLIIIIAMIFITTTSQQTNAQSKETIESMVACLQDVPLSTDTDGYTNCTSKIAAECFEYDPPGGFGEGELTAENCFLSVAEQIKSKMNDYLENGWPDANSTGYQIRKIAIEYAIKRSELECEYQKALQGSGNKNLSEEVGLRKYTSLNKFAALCLFGQIVGNYWTVIVHEQLR